MIPFSVSAIIVLFVYLFSSSSFPLASSFQQQDEAPFLQLYDYLLNYTYTTPLPPTLLSACSLPSNSHVFPNISTSSGQIAQITLPSSPSTVYASAVSSTCGLNSHCIIPVGVTLVMDSNFIVASLTVFGSVLWTDSTQSQSTQWLCSGVVAVASGGSFQMDLSSGQHSGIIYIMNNGLYDGVIGYRAFGSYGNSSIAVTGRPLVRTWSLLSLSPSIGSNIITLMHDPYAMSWAIGDRIQIAPTPHGNIGFAQSAFISAINAAGRNTINLTDDIALTIPSRINQIFQSSHVMVSAPDWTATMSAEVINLSRNILITGDDFENVQCNSQGFMGCQCDPTIPRSVCTMGLHTIAVGPSTLQYRYIKVEKGGQRGVLGRYPIHFHYGGICPNCIAIGNAVETSMQRAFDIHETSAAIVEFNVASGVRGALYYFEDGNEVFNVLNYNVAICPWPQTYPGGMDHPLNGCHIPGTDNGQADTSLNQAGFWGDSFQNYFIGNRAANNFNSMLWDAQGFEGGKGGAQGEECANNQLIGRMEGFNGHSSGRFGTYILVSVYPKHTDRSISHNGFITNFATCDAFDSNGNDRGYPQTIYRHTDWGNTFVGQYGLGDVNYIEHFSQSNDNLIYWKETKNFADGCSSHLINSIYQGGNMALPSGHGTFIIENVTFSGSLTLENNHHCGIGVTGILCMPTYILHNVKFINVDITQNIMLWGANNGAMLTLSPPFCANPTGENTIIPAGYCSVVHPYWTYLLTLKDSNNHPLCQNSTSMSVSLSIIFQNGILCKGAVRRLEIYSFGLTVGSNPPDLALKLFQNGQYVSTAYIPYWQIGDDTTNTRKQGYATTVLIGQFGQSYTLSWANGSAIPTTWIVEFSDTVIANRWGVDTINLTILGRNCPSPVTSLHDRQWIWGDGNDNYLVYEGRGACTSYPDQTLIDCKATAPSDFNYLVQQCALCSSTNCGPNGFCDCGLGACMCNPGFSGPNCENDICDEALCLPDPSKAACNLRYLGGTLPATKSQCACAAGLFGDMCKSNPCLNVTCSMNGNCTAISATAAVCQCNPGFDGPLCGHPCVGGNCLPPCSSDSFRYYANSNFAGANLGATSTSTAEECGVYCQSFPQCIGFSWTGGGCYIKSQGNIVTQTGCTAATTCNFTNVANPLGFEQESASLGPPSFSFSSAPYPSSSSSTGSGYGGNSSSSSSLSGGAIAGVIIGAVVILLIGIALVYFLCFRSKGTKESNSTMSHRDSSGIPLTTIQN